MSKPLPEAILKILAERVGRIEREAVAFVREGGSTRVAMLLSSIQSAEPDDPLGKIIVALAELGLLHALRLYLGAANTSAASVPAASVN